MLSYRHAYHAGNHADILKHYCLFEVLNYFIAKQKGFSYFDTHAGAGLYDLSSTSANKTCEYQQGVLKLLGSEKLSDRLMLFKQFLMPFVSKNQYPGSAYLSRELMPTGSDYGCFLYELHSNEAEILTQIMAQLKKPVKIFRADGFKGLLASVPPRIRRAVIILDPSYEMKRDYVEVVETVDKAYQKFSTGCYLIWYPLLAHTDNHQMIKRLKEISSKYIQAELCVTSKETAVGMYGSGMWVINPTYRLDAYLQSGLPRLLTLLKQDDKANFVLQKGQL